MCPDRSTKHVSAEKPSAGVKYKLTLHKLNINIFETSHIYRMGLKLTKLSDTV